MDTRDRQVTGSDPAEVIRAFHHAFSRGDMEAACAAVAADCITDEAEGLPFSGKFVGPSGFADVVSQMQTNLLAEVTDSWFQSTGSGVVGNISVRFTSRRTGRQIDTKLLEYYTVDNGLITSFDVYYKNPEAIRVLAEQG